MKYLIHIFFLLLPLFSTAQTENNSSVKSSNVYVYKDVARPAAQMVSTYPYDIALMDSQGDTLQSSDVLAQNERPTVLLFWLTTCMPCRRELTAIAGKYEAWQKELDFNFYAISIDFPKNREAFFKRVQESQWPFPVLMDVNREFRQIMPGQLNGLPQLFVLSAERKIVHHKQKYRPGDEDQLFAFLKSLPQKKK